MAEQKTKDKKTSVTASRERGHQADYIAISLAPVLTGTRGDHYDNVRLTLTLEDALVLRDQLSAQLARRGEDFTNANA